MLNLSSYPLKENEVSLLTKGLKFIPKPSKPNKEVVREAFENFSRRIKLAEFFSHSKDTEREPKLFHPKSNWVPPDVLLNPEIIENLNELKNDIENVSLSQQETNLTKDELKAIKSLRNNKAIIIKPADKGSSTVIMNRADYLKEGYRQLSNEKHYKKLPKPIYPNVSKKISDTLDFLHSKNIINKKQLEYLDVPPNPRDRKFYLLPKIHKEKNTWGDGGRIPPGRPIVSDCSSDTYRISEYIDHFLGPLAITHDSYVRDTPNFLEKLSSINPAPDSLLITLDVDSLYTNIDNQDGFEAVKESFNKNPDPKRPDKQILELLKICLENNDFTFNDEWFLQVGGTAMGKKFAPNYANLFMAKWEQEALSKCPKQPQFYLRYLDDIFIIWPHSREDFNNFFEILNSHHPNITLKSCIAEKSIDFLDVTIFKGPQFNSKGILDTKVYFKPTDTHELLHKSSYHPKHTFKGIVQSQIIRFYRICNNTSDFDNACSILFRTLKHRGYAPRFLRTMKKETLLRLQPNGKSSKCNKARCKTCPHITETNSILSTQNTLVPLKENLNCQSEGVVYAIKCSNCKAMYVGETSRKLHERFTEHRSNINTKKSGPVAKHFNEICPNMDFLTITPLEHVQRKILDTFMGLLDRVDILALLQREQYWIKKLKTIAPFGLNKRREIPPPIPFALQFSDQAADINKLVKTFYEKFRLQRFGTFLRYQFVSAYKRNKNLKDMLISAS